MQREINMNLGENHQASRELTQVSELPTLEPKLGVLTATLLG
jgi:hypothetical protein